MFLARAPASGPQIQQRRTDRRAGHQEAAGPVKHEPPWIVLETEPEDGLPPNQHAKGKGEKKKTEPAAHCIG
jgi:hypothetical protein